MQLRVTHTTTYRYSEPAWSSLNELRLAPEDTPRQSPGDHLLLLDPVSEFATSRDLFGNLVHEFEVVDPHEELTITSITEAETSSSQKLILAAEQVPLGEENDATDEDLHPYQVDSTFVKKCPNTWREAIDLSDQHTGSWADLLSGINHHIFESTEYKDQVLHGMTPSTDIQQSRRGTCQDFAHLFLALCRALDIPARYRSGYLYDPGLVTGEAAWVGASQTHAWIEVHVPTVGWLGLDPTNDCWVNEHYVSVALGRDYHDVAPVRGSLIGGGDERTLEVSVVVDEV
ncbi:MAG: transglutaminase family protein [Verrucomicrobiota bacterium]